MRWSPLLPTLLAASACEPFVDVMGTVRDTVGVPIRGAVVTLHVGDDPRSALARTDSAGRFAVTWWGNPEPPIRVRVCGAGYVPEQREFRSAVPESLAFVLRQGAAGHRVPVQAPAC